MIYFTSDTHFNHKNVIGYCNRPYRDTREMDEALIENWNNTVRKDNEHIYVLGDFCFAGKDYTKSIIHRLKGYKILVKGNHDKDVKTMLDLGFDKVIENDRIKVGNHSILVSHFPYHPVTHHIAHPTSQGTKITQQIDGTVDGRYLHKRILDDGKSWLFHGHVHTAWKVNGRMINVGVDQWGMKPVGHERLLEIVDGKRTD